MVKSLFQTTALAAFLAVGGMVNAQETAVPGNPLRDAYFGETHMHTAFSLDAYIGGARLMPSDSLRFAKGEEVTMPDGTLKQLKRPLDFAAVTDHAEYIGEMYSTMYKDAPGYDNPDLETLRTMTDIEERMTWFLKYVISSNRSSTPQHPDFFAGPSTIKSAWQVIVDAAEAHNDPGKFTTLIGFEWSAAPKGANLHRNVIFRGSDVPSAPVSYIDINQEERLWDWLAVQERAGRSVLAIPHNSNASKGRMFPDTDSFGNAIDLKYAQIRQRFEPLVEMMQIKGNSEVHRKFWAADEFSDFENADSIQKSSGRSYARRDFVREGLKVGLQQEQALGVNPFKYGFIGGTDNHNGLMSDVAEDDFIGGHGPEDGTVKERRTGDVSGWIDSKDLSIGSLAGVWATENTRAGVWDAMKRRETFATSGPRIKVRMFGGVSLTRDPADVVAMVQEGYLLGVPMGGNLAPNSVAPTFTVYAEKDPLGANLDRIQIIKGWVDRNGDLNEKIVDVVWAGDREIMGNGKLPGVGNTVDLTTAMYTNGIGAPLLIGSWTDVDFNAEDGAFYYARAIEIPTPRWSTYDAVRNNLPLLSDVPAIIQERAWGSPIWYSPN
jgi:hypothetical protein